MKKILEEYGDTIVIIAFGAIIIGCLMYLIGIV